MSSDDHDHTPAHERPDGGPDRVPPDDAPAEAREQAQAASFAALIDRLTAGQPLPPAMTAEERMLVETAGMVRASARPQALAPERRSALIDDVLAGAGRGGTRVARAAQPARASGPGEAADAPASRDSDRTSDVIDLAERRRGRYFRALPWAVTVASVAAALLLALWHARSGTLATGTPTVVAESAPPALDALHRSRPADALIGEIPRARAGAARARIDVIYADRLIGYRDLRLRGGRL